MVILSRRRKKMSKLYRNWPVHNLIGHPLSEIVYWIVRPLGKEKAEDICGWVHDITIPVDHYIGRG
jgi:hypothetical protein